MKKEVKPFSWKVKNFCCNKQVIEDYDVLKYREDMIKKLKKKCATKEEFASELRSELQYRYWSRAEYELVIEIDENDQIWLNPWCGCRNPQDVRVNVTDDDSYDWRGFAEKHISQYRGNDAKIDIFDQLTYGNQFEKLVTYLWTTRLKYERDNPKFHEE